MTIDDIEMVKLILNSFQAVLSQVKRIELEKESESKYRLLSKVSKLIMRTETYE